MAPSIYDRPVRKASLPIAYVSRLTLQRYITTSLYFPA